MLVVKDLTIIHKLVWRTKLENLLVQYNTRALLIKKNTSLLEYRRTIQSFTIFTLRRILYKKGIELN